MIRFRGAAALLLIFVLAGCGRIIPDAAPPDVARAPVDQPLPPAPPLDYDYQPSPLPHLQTRVPPGENAAGAALSVSSVSSLDIENAAAARILHVFRVSCPSLINREDRSGLTIAADWVDACRAAAQWRPERAGEFFESRFRAVQVGDGSAFATGYYEPEIAASRERIAGYDTPIYRRPPDLVEQARTRGASQADLPPVIRFVDGEPQPYFDRAAIESGALAGRGLEIAWARDPVDFYFLQVQGSGLLRQPDGTAFRLGYAANNGFDYVSIGRLMRERGLLGDGETTAEGIAAWLRANRDEGRALMQENPRYIFFGELDQPAPNGSLGRPVTARGTVAADPAYVPLGAPVFLDMEHDVADGLWVAQDTGGAIQGANRFDTYWGSGEAAFQVASGLASRGQAWILIPRVSAERLARAD